MIKRKKYGKKIMSIILAASMTISLAACGGKDNADSKQPAQQESMNTEINTESIRTHLRGQRQTLSSLHQNIP